MQNSHEVGLPTNLGENLLFYAIAHSDISDVIHLIEEDECTVNVRNINGATPLHYAVYYDNPTFVEVLL